MNTGKSQASHLGHGIAVGHSMGGNWEGGGGVGGGIEVKLSQLGSFREDFLEDSIGLPSD